jgi:acetyl esterase/lipase
MQTTAQDPLQDDNIEFNQKLSSLNVKCQLSVLNGLHHGFLNFITASKDCLRASKFVSSIIQAALDPLGPQPQPQLLQPKQFYNHKPFSNKSNKK